jgi:hypothetical protein
MLSTTTSHGFFKERLLAKYPNLGFCSAIENN